MKHGDVIRNKTTGQIGSLHYSMFGGSVVYTYEEESMCLKKSLGDKISNIERNWETLCDLPKGYEWDESGLYVKKISEMNGFKTLLSLSNNDLEVYESQENGSVHYHISIEGYIGFNNLQSFVDLYEEFREKLKCFLLEKWEYPQTERDNWTCLYSVREMKICYEGDCYWIFLEPLKTENIWETYYYLEDVIKQLKKAEN